MGRDASIEDRSCLIAARRRLEIEATHHLVDITGRKTLFGWRKSPPNGKYQEVFSFDDSDESPTFVSVLLTAKPVRSHAGRIERGKDLEVASNKRNGPTGSRYWLSGIVLCTMLAYVYAGRSVKLLSHLT
jgi:hypothetical protein